MAASGTAPPAPTLRHPNSSQLCHRRRSLPLFHPTAPCVRVSPSFEIQNAVAGAGAFKENSVAWDIIDKRETERSFNIIR